jgi:hypothetical protein
MVVSRFVPNPDQIIAWCLMCRFKETATESFKSYGLTPLPSDVTLNLHTLCDDRMPLNAIGYRTAGMAFEAGAWLKYPASFWRLPRQDRFDLEHV